MVSFVLFVVGDVDGDDLFSINSDSIYIYMALIGIGEMASIAFFSSSYYFTKTKLIGCVRLCVYASVPQKILRTPKRETTNQLL